MVNTFKILKQTRMQMNIRIFANVWENDVIYDLVCTMKNEGPPNSPYINDLLN